MNLSQLRKLLKDYEQTWYLRKYFYGDHNEAKKIRLFLEKFKNMDDHYELSVTDIFELLNIAPNNSLLLVKLIQDHFRNDYLLDIFLALHHAGLITEHNFERIHGFSYEKRLLLRDLFCGLPMDQIRLNGEILEAVLTITANSNSFKCKRMEKCLKFLHDKNQLTPTALNFLVHVAVANDDILTYIVFELFQKMEQANCYPNDLCLSSLAKLTTSDFISVNNHLIELFELFTKAKIFITTERLNTLFSLSTANIRRLQKVALGLADNKLLDQNSFELSFQKVSQKLPSISEAGMKKYSRQETNTLRSEIILDDQIHLFPDSNKEYQKGGFGKVKKGFHSADADTPSFAIKTLGELDPTKAEHEAVREVKYSQLLNRLSFYYNTEKFEGVVPSTKAKVVTPWQPGKSLFNYDRNELLTIPFKDRVQCLISGLSDLNTLHQHYRIHGDVKSGNFILNLNSLTLKLIDFGSSHKKGSLKLFPETPRYRDPHTPIGNDCIYKDLYAMGVVIMDLFPEIYPAFSNGLNKPISKSALTITERAVTNLIDSMVHPNGALRATSADALAFCEYLINHFDTFDETTLNKIKQGTIDRPETTIEDVLRDAIRPSI